MVPSNCHKIKSVYNTPRIICAIGVLLVILNIPASVFAQNEYLAVRVLRTEYLHNPLGIDMPHPRFSWIIKSWKRDINQAAWQVEVASSRQNLVSGNPDMWNSSKQSSGKSINIAYGGKTLKSDHSYYWRVRVWDQHGIASSWSKIASFHTGLFQQKDWQGEWIGAKDSTISSPLLRKQFDVKKKIKSAYVFICGLGYYELFLNGHKVGNHELDPGTSDFNKRALYVAYNVKKYLQNGQNAVGVWLGNGYFRMSRKRPFRYYGSRPQLLFQMNIEYTDGSSVHIISNPTWKVSSSPIVANSVYDGEIYDARREEKGWDRAGFNDSNWGNAIKLNPPKSRVLSAQLMPPITVEKTLYPIRMREPLNNIYVYDFGQNFSGWPVLHVNGGEGDKVIMKTAEVTKKDMIQMEGGNTQGVVDTIDAVEDRSAKARDIYILDGKPGMEVYAPRFTYQGFRYVQLQGFPGKPNLTSVTADFVHTAVKKVGTFDCSNSLFNRIHHNVLWGQRSDLMSMPTDCDQRDERMGWMADADLSAEEAIHNFNMAAFYTNWIREIQDEQHKNGSVPDIVPDHKWLAGTHIGTPSWQVAYPLLVWYVHRYYDDNRILKEHYKSLVKWMGYMKSISHDYIITKGRGDWVPPERAGTPGDHSIALTSTGYFYKSARIMSKISGILGKKQDQQYFIDLAGKIKQSYNRHFLNTSKGYYGTDSQTSNAFPLYIGIVPKDYQKAVVKHLVENIMSKHDGHIWAGILGTKALIEALPEFGQTKVLYKMADKTTYPGWGYMISQGATTLWERWGAYRYFNAGMNSLNHIMFGSIDEFFYKDLAGIRVEKSGFRKILIQPHIIGGMTFAKGSVNTVRGVVSSDWKKAGDEISLKVTIPANSQALVDIPKSNLKGPYIVKESGMTIWNNNRFQNGDPGVQNVKDIGNYIQATIGSGSYSFKLSTTDD